MKKIYGIEAMYRDYPLWIRWSGRYTSQRRVFQAIRDIKKVYGNNWIFRPTHIYL